MKASTYAQDAGAEIAQIRRLLTLIKFKIELKLIKLKKGTPSRFGIKPLDHLLKMYDQKALEMREECYEKESETNAKHMEYY